VLVRWAAYQGSVAGTALRNMLVFVATRSVLPPLVASTAGRAAAASGNVVIGDRYVFRGHQNRALARMTRDRPESAA
jgi:putative flippase GtrA